MSIKGVDKGLFILPGNRQTWPCIRSQSTDFGKQLLTGIPATRGVSLTKNNNWKEDNQKRRDMKDLAFLETRKLLRVVQNPLSILKHR